MKIRREGLDLRRRRSCLWGWCLVALTLLAAKPILAQELPLVENVELQPLASQALRLIEAMEYLGSPFRREDQEQPRKAAELQDVKDSQEAVVRIQKILDRYVLIAVRIDAESRVKVDRGPARAELMEQGWRPYLVKVNNQAPVTAELRVESPNAAPVYRRSTNSSSPENGIKPHHLMQR